MRTRAAALAFPKPRPKRLEKQDRQQTQASLERAENAKVKARSGGRCEMRELWPNAHIVRCECRASDIHHLVFGAGRRGRGASALAEHKLHVCAQDHADITGHVLRATGLDRERAATVYYERVR